MSDEEGVHPDPYNPDDRALQLKRLSGYGQAPDGTTEGGEAFDATLPWPQCFWWRDRDRIVLLHEFLEVWPPMGHQGWEESIRDRVVLLWGKKFLWDGANMSDFRDTRCAATDTLQRYAAALGICVPACQHLPRVSNIVNEGACVLHYFSQYISARGYLKHKGHRL